MAKRKNIVDLTGQVFNQWTVISYDETSDRRTRWTCKCSCGNIRNVLSFHLKSGASSNCGCVQIKKQTMHGMYGTPEYVSWIAMKTRCTNDNHEAYADYKGRGIYVCEHWLSFDNFYADMGNKPTEDHSIDRVDNNGSYTCGHCDHCKSRNAPSNCRWATTKQQCRNMRTNRVLTHNGITMTLVEWEETTGINHCTITSRLDRGWATEKALTTPVNQRPIP